MPPDSTASSSEEQSEPTRSSQRQAQRNAAQPQEAEIILHCERENFDGATQLIMRLYSNEIRSFLRSRTHNRVSMEEVYSVFSEDVWKGLPRTRFQGQVRAWVYTLARNALARHARFKARWRTRHAAADLDELGGDARLSFSPPRADLSRLEPLLVGLSADDRRLLEQRLVEGRAFRELAFESAHRSGKTSETELARESARLRKRFQLLLGELRRHVAHMRNSEVG